MNARFRRLVLTLGRALVRWAEVRLVLSGYAWPDGRDEAIANELIVTTAVRFAAVYDCGLPADDFSPAFDLQRTGKLQEVLYHAAKRLDVDHGLRTVADVVALLQRSRLQATIGTLCQAPANLVSSSSAPTSPASSPG